MANILIRDVPGPVHDELRRRASQAGVSLQQYLQRVLAEAVELPELGEWLAVAASEARLDLDAATAAELVRDDRDDRS